MSDNSRVDLYKAGQRLVVFGITKYPKREGGEGSYWTKIGSAFVNRDGSLNMHLDYLPAKGQALQVRPAEEREERGSAERAF